jgi:hypothetical protein
VTAWPAGACAGEAAVLLSDAAIDRDRAFDRNRFGREALALGAERLRALAEFTVTFLSLVSSVWWPSLSNMCCPPSLCVVTIEPSALCSGSSRRSGASQDLAGLHLRRVVRRVKCLCLATGVFGSPFSNSTSITSPSRSRGRADVRADHHAVTVAGMLDRAASSRSRPSDGTRMPFTAWVFEL